MLRKGIATRLALLPSLLGRFVLCGGECHFFVTFLPSFLSPYYFASSFVSLSADLAPNSDVNCGGTWIVAVTPGFTELEHQNFNKALSAFKCVSNVASTCAVP